MFLHLTLTWNHIKNHVAKVKVDPHAKNQGRSSNGSAMRAQRDKQTDGQTDGCYQIYNLPAFLKLCGRWLLKNKMCGALIYLHSEEPRRAGRQILLCSHLAWSLLCRSSAFCHLLAQFQPCDRNPCKGETIFMINITKIPLVYRLKSVEAIKMKFVAPMPEQIATTTIHFLKVSGKLC